MIHPLPLHAPQRKMQDMMEIESVISLLSSCSGLDATTKRHVERLVRLTGTKEFIPAISLLRSMVEKKEWEVGYIVPRKHLAGLMQPGEMSGTSEEAGKTPVKNGKETKLAKKDEKEMWRILETEWRKLDPSRPLTFAETSLIARAR